MLNLDLLRRLLEGRPQHAPGRLRDNPQEDSEGGMILGLLIGTIMTIIDVIVIIINIIVSNLNCYYHYY